MESTATICPRCVMDCSDPNITFFADGTCNNCRHAQTILDTHTEKHSIEFVVASIRKLALDSSPSSDYDCIVGISGGVDSSWLLHVLVNAGLRVYVHHVDTGWNTHKAVGNIYKLCSKLSLPIHTHVVDWNLMKKIQTAFFYLGILNQDIPQDMAIFSSQIKACTDNKISILASGANNTTESILPTAWSHHWHDVFNLQSIYTHFWGTSLSNFPYTSFEDLASYRLWHTKKLTTINIFDHIEYNKTIALSKLEDIYDYVNYGQKHGESAWTAYYQTIYLPSLYSIDKRKAHLSNLIINNEITRKEAIEQLNKPSLCYSDKLELANFIALKLSIPLEHALNPGKYILPVQHNVFGPSKELIDYFTSLYSQAEVSKRNQIFNDFMSKYSMLYSNKFT